MDTAPTPDGPAPGAPAVRTPPAPPDRAAAARTWAAYAAAHPDRAATGPDGADLVVDRFGDSVELAEELLGVVVDGVKRATADLVAEFALRGEPLPRVGGHWVACDGHGVPRVVLRTTELRLALLDDVDAGFAWDEGEDDRTLASWRLGHRRYWERTWAARGAVWTPDEEIVLERFAVVWPPELAD